MKLRRFHLVRARRETCQETSLKMRAAIRRVGRASRRDESPKGRRERANKWFAMPRRLINCSSALEAAAAAAASANKLEYCKISPRRLLSLGSSAERLARRSPYNFAAKCRFFDCSSDLIATVLAGVFFASASVYQCGPSRHPSGLELAAAARECLRETAANSSGKTDERLVQVSVAYLFEFLRLALDCEWNISISARADLAGQLREIETCAGACSVLSSLATV